MDHLTILLVYLGSMLLQMGNKTFSLKPLLMGICEYSGLEGDEEVMKNLFGQLALPPSPQAFCFSGSPHFPSPTSRKSPSCHVQRFNNVLC